MPNPMKKIISLVKRTGDHVIVVDAEGQPQYVLMSFSEYEKLITGKENLAALNEDEMLDKINRDVASWRASQQDTQLGHWDSVEQAIQGAKNRRTQAPAASAVNSLNQEQNQPKDDQHSFEPI